MSHRDPQILDADIRTGITSIWHHDIHTGDANIIETVQDAEPIVEMNKARASNFDERSGWKGDGFHLVASIPNVVMMDLKKRGVLDDPAAFKKWLNDKDNSAFRTRPGRV